MSVLILSKREKELTAVISVALYVIITISALSGIESLFKSLKPYFEIIDAIDMTVFIKIGGISVAAAVSSAICDIAGQKELSNILDIVATVEIILVVFPVLTEMLKSILKIFGG